MKESIKKSKQKNKEPLPKEYFVRPKESKWATEKFGPGKIDIIFCPTCNIVYYEKSWHHDLLNDKHITKARRVAFELCPVCAMAKHHQYEGKIVITGVPFSEKQEILKLAESFGKKSYARDPLDRIMDISSFNGKITILTSENQLAQRLAKKIQETHKKIFSRPIIHKGKGEDMFVVTMEYVNKNPNAKAQISKRKQN